MQSPPYLVRNSVIIGIDQHWMQGCQTAQIHQHGIASNKMYATLDFYSCGEKSCIRQ
jgi:hypothetical protein